MYRYPPPKTERHPNAPQTSTGSLRRIPKGLGGNARFYYSVRDASTDLPAKLTELAITVGSSGSGKSTAVKQMKIAHQGGFPVEERVAYRAAIYQNLLESAQAIVFTMRGLSIEPVGPRTRV